MASAPLPTVPPPSLEEQRADGYAAADECNNREPYEGEDEDDEDAGEVAINGMDDPAECPWPLYTDEGRAWIAGWNQYCIDQGLDYRHLRPSREP